MLYERCTYQKISVYGVAHAQWVVHFRVILQGILREQWYELAAKLNLVRLDEEKDEEARLETYDQYWVWIKSALPGDEQVYMLGVAAICWAIWKARNKTCFEKKRIKNPAEIIFLHVLLCIIGQGFTKKGHNRL
jgi:hypothetical protein